MASIMLVKENAGYPCHANVDQDFCAGFINLRLLRRAVIPLLNSRLEISRKPLL